MEPSNRIEQYLDFMMLVLRADGVVDLEEKKQMLTLMVEGMQLREELVERYRAALDSPDWSEPSDEELAAIAAGLDPGSVAHLVRDAYTMAGADGEIDSAEMKLVQRFLKQAGIPEERFQAIDDWARVSLELASKANRLFQPA